MTVLYRQTAAWVRNHRARTVTVLAARCRGLERDRATLEDAVAAALADNAATETDLAREQIAHSATARELDATKAALRRVRADLAAQIERQFIVADPDLDELAATCDSTALQVKVARPLGPETIPHEFVFEATRAGVDWCACGRMKNTIAHALGGKRIEVRPPRADPDYDALRKVTAERNELARRAEAAEELVRLLDKTGGKCHAPGGGRRCEREPGHRGKCRVLFDGAVPVDPVEPSPWTPDALALLAAVTSDGEVDR